ncbi:hypothetical protein Ancab_012491 [Ancistrocladus abbreviatus]
MTMDDLIAKQMRVTRQENAHCELVSFDRDAANAFQHYVNESLAFAVKRGGFMYGTVSDVGKVEVNFIYEPPQVGMEERLMLMRDSDEEKVVDAIVAGSGMRRVGFIFTQTIGQNKKDYTMSNLEVARVSFVIFAATMWSIWLSRNELIFRGENILEQKLVSLIRIRSFEWVRFRSKWGEFSFEQWDCNARNILR